MDIDVVVVGGGPAGATCAMFAARLGLATALVDGMGIGGQLINLHSIKDYPGFTDVAGWDLSAVLTEQVMNSGVNTMFGEVEGLRNSGGRWVAEVGTEPLAAKAVVIATGGTPIPVPFGEAYEGRGISYCATCDGSLYRGKPVAVWGGGDFAMSEASYLADLASQVYVLYPQRELVAAMAWQSEAREKQNIEFLPAVELTAVTGANGVEGIDYVTVPGREGRSLPVAAVFGASGLVPNSSLVRGLVEMDDAGFIKTDERLAASAPGIFAVGDVRTGSPMLIAAAVGDGTRAALAVAEYIRKASKP